jgi:hypothetical protein
VDNFYKALEPWKMGRLRTCLIILSIKNWRLLKWMEHRMIISYPLS